MSTSNYLLWEQAILPGACALSGMTGFEDDWQLLYGVPVDDALPPTTRLAMNPDHPKDTALTDSLYNVDRLIIASPKLRALLEGLHIPELQYLEVPVVDLQGRPVREGYVLVHLLEPVDCLDVAACGATFSSTDEDSIDTMKRLVIDESRIDPSRLLFRPKGFYKVRLVHRELAAKLNVAGITGVRWVELSQWPER